MCLPKTAGWKPRSLPATTLDFHHKTGQYGGFTLGRREWKTYVELARSLDLSTVDYDLKDGSMSDFDVAYAVYGGLRDGNSKIVYAFDVTSQLSRALNALGATGIVQCGNIFCDPLLNYQKHFGALVNNRYFACKEGQTVDFATASVLNQ